jgi:hypothetical protein
LSDKLDFIRDCRKLALKKILGADVRESSSDGRAILKYSAAEARYDHVDDLGRIVAGYWDPAICATGSGSSTVPNALGEVRENKNAGVWSKVASDLD